MNPQQDEKQSNLSTASTLSNEGSGLSVSAKVGISLASAIVVAIVVVSAVHFIGRKTRQVNAKNNAMYRNARF